MALLLGVALFTALPALASAQTTEAETVANETVVFIHCYRRGIYKVTGGELTDAGLDLSQVVPSRMALVRLGKPVAFHPVLASPDHFGPDDAFYFFSQGGRRDDVPYINIRKEFESATQVFALHIDTTQYKPLHYEVADAPVAPADPRAPNRGILLTALDHYENDAHWAFPGSERFSTAGPNPDFNYMRQITYPATNITESTTTLAFPCPLLIPNTTSTLELKLAGMSRNRTHRVQISMNEGFSDVVEWEGFVEKIYSFDLPAGTMRPRGANNLNLCNDRAIIGQERNNRRTPDNVYLDWFDLRYKQFTAVNPRTSSNEFIVQDDIEKQQARDFEVLGFTDPSAMVMDLDAHVVFKPLDDPPAPSRFYSMRVRRQTDVPTTLIAAAASAYQPPHRIEVTRSKGLFINPPQCEMLILSHPDFIPVLQRLAEWKNRRGLKTEIVDLVDICNEGSSGYITTDAVRDFIRATAHANTDEATRLKYVLLVGDSRSISKYVTHFPAYAYLQQGSHANDNYFATLDDPLDPPDLAVGRISADTITEVNNVVRKIITYEGHSEPQPWRNRFFLISAGFEWAVKTNVDLIENFARPNHLVHFLQTDLHNRDREYHTVLNSRLVYQLNQGALVTVFNGHGGGTVWEVGPTAIDSVMSNGFQRHLFNQSHVEELTNYDSLSLVLALTCYTNDFDNPYQAQTLGETFVNSRGGAIAVIGSSSRMDTGNLSRILEAFFEVAEENPDWRLGRIYQETKVRTRNRFVNQAINLLGDPSLEFHLPRPGLTPTIEKWDPATSHLSVSFTTDHQLPPNAEIHCFIVDNMQSVLAKWVETASGNSGSIAYTPHSPPAGVKRLLVLFTTDADGAPLTGTVILPPHSIPRIVAASPNPSQAD